ncbi:hypothetical protein H6G98_03190 [Nostoc sp. FACHB-857]|nr:hypothetical protein [Nostoc sp. FACHB-857]
MTVDYLPKSQELFRQCPMPNAQCPMPHAQCPMPHAPCPMPNAPFTYLPIP